MRKFLLVLLGVLAIAGVGTAQASVVQLDIEADTMTGYWEVRASITDVSLPGSVGGGTSEVEGLAAFAIQVIAAGAGTKVTSGFVKGVAPQASDATKTGALLLPPVGPVGGTTAIGSYGFGVLAGDGVASGNNWINMVAGQDTTVNIYAYRRVGIQGGSGTNTGGFPIWQGNVALANGFFTPGAIGSLTAMWEGLGGNLLIGPQGAGGWVSGVGSVLPMLSGGSALTDVYSWGDDGHIPEPSTWVLLTVGTACVVPVIRRRLRR